MNIVRPFARLLVLAASAWLTIDAAIAADAYWMERASLFRELKSTAAIVMVGDSLTDGAEWQELFPGISIANRGIDGDTTDGILKRLDGILPLHAEKAFLMVGINDFIEAERSVDAVFANYRKIISVLHRSGTRVYVQSTLMCNERKASVKSCSTANEKIRQLNKRLAEPGAGEFTFVDINRSLSGPHGLKDELTCDGIHLNGRGYLLWRNEISAFAAAGK